MIHLQQLEGQMPCLLLFTMSVCFPFFSQCQRASPSFHNVSVLPLLFTMSVCFPFFSQCQRASPSFHNVSVLPLLFTMSVCFPFFSQCQRASSEEATQVQNGYARSFIGLARTIYIRCIYGMFGREITKYTVIYGV